MTLRVGGRRFRTDVTGGSSTVGGAIVCFVLCTHGFSGGIAGVVYCERAAKGRSQLLGAQTPTNTRHAATSRLALMNKTVNKYASIRENELKAYCS